MGNPVTRLIKNLFTLLLCGWLAGGSSAPAEQPTHVLFIAVDDLRDWTMPFGTVRPITPNLDRLSQRGVHFRHAYCQIPLCNPTRASIMTGLRPDRTGVFDLRRHFRQDLPAVVTLPQLFRQHGWQTMRVGKVYHYDVPRGIGTDGLDDPESWERVVNPAGRDIREEHLITNPTPERPISAALSWLAADGSGDEQTDGLVTSKAIELLGQTKDQRAFIGVGFYRPHTPYVAPKQFFNLYPLDQIALPQAPPDDRDDIPAAAFAHNNPTPNYGLDERTCRQAIQAYLACTSFIDAQVGRLLDALDELQLAERTVVVLWSDHGYHLGEHLGVWQKRTLFEESARSPLVILAPGAAGNGHPCDRIVEFVDLYPTLVELCGLDATRSLDGRSLAPLLDQPDRHWEGAAVTQVLRPTDERLPEPVMGRSVRTERFRYTQWNGGQYGEELYDHQNDPGEFINLAGRDELNQVVTDLRELLDQKADPLPPDPETFDPARL